MLAHGNSVCTTCRRENLKLFLKGDRCFTEKCSFERRSYPPGQHGQGRLALARVRYGEGVRLAGGPGRHPLHVPRGASDGNRA